MIVVIPAYREAKTIGQLVTTVLSSASVVVIDDNSGDATGDIAAEAGATVVYNQQNLGYEKSLNIAFQTAAQLGARAVLTMDADGEHDPSHVEQFKHLLIEKGIPLVLGVRASRPRIAEAIMGRYVKFRFGIDDIFCGMKGYQIGLWHQYGCFDKRQSVGTELTLAAVRGGIEFEQIKVSGTPRVDHPRFDTHFSANLRITKAIGRALSSDKIAVDK